MGGGWAYLGGLDFKVEERIARRVVRVLRRADPRVGALIRPVNNDLCVRQWGFSASDRRGGGGVGVCLTHIAAFYCSPSYKSHTIRSCSL